MNPAAIVNAEMEEEVIQEKEEWLRNSMREVSKEIDMFNKEDVFEEEIENAATKLESSNCQEAFYCNQKQSEGHLEID